MENYYDVLGIGPDANTSQVKSAFRRQAKKHHPDITASREGSGGGGPAANRADEAAMRLLLEAYRMLSDPERRRAYDRSLRRRNAEESGFDYRVFLKGRPDDPESQAKLVIFDLLHELEDEALEVYERSKSFDDFRLERWLERGEAMDTELCLAEEYEKRERWLKAYNIYRRLIIMEKEQPWFRYFFDVVALRFRTLVLLKLPKTLDEEDFLDRLEEAASLEVSRKDSAQFLRKKAEVHLRRDETSEAVDSLRRASGLEPRLAGLSALRRRVDLQLGG